MLELNITILNKQIINNYPDTYNYNKNLINKKLCSVIEKYLPEGSNIIYLDGKHMKTTKKLYKIDSIKSLTIIEHNINTYKIMIDNNYDKKIKIINNSIQNFLSENENFYNVYYLDYMCCIDGTYNNYPLDTLDTILSKQLNEKLIIAFTFSLRNRLGNFKNENQTTTILSEIKKYYQYYRYKIQKIYVKKYIGINGCKMINIIYNLVKLDEIYDNTVDFIVVDDKITGKKRYLGTSIFIF